MKHKSVIKNGGLYIFGNLFNKAIAFMTVPIFTRILTTEEYGIVNTYSSWVSFMAVFVGMSMGQTIRNAFVDMREELGKYISSIFTLGGLNFGLICVLYALVSNHLDIPKPLVWLCLIESLSNFVINSLLMKYVMEEEAVKRTFLMVLPNLLGAILSVVLIQVLQEEKQYGRILGTCISTSVFGIAIMAFYIIKYRSFINKRLLVYVLPLSIPLVFHGIACNILGASDRTIITYFRGAAETGVYSLIYNLSMVANVVTSSAESVWIPKMTDSLLTKDYKKTNYEIMIYLYSVTFAFCGLLTIAPELVLILGGKEYMSGLRMIFPVVTSSFTMFLYSIYVNVEFFYKKTRIIAISTFISAGLNLVLNVIFVPKYGATAAAYTTLVSYLASFILHSVNARKLNHEVASYVILVPAVVVIFLAGVVTNCLAETILWRWTVMAICGIVYIIVYKKCLFQKENGD